MLLLLVAASCRSIPRYAAAVPVAGDEIIVAGERFHTGTRVVTWWENVGYDAYKAVSAVTLRQPAVTSEAPPQSGESSSDVTALQDVVDQLVLHYDAAGLSKHCFEALKARQLSVHFLLDIDGTIYQTLDLRERASHATIANNRSIGIEIANIGAYPPSASQPLDRWYRRDQTGGTVLTIPAPARATGVLTANFRGKPARSEPVTGVVQDQRLRQYDFTPEQYAALGKLTAALCRVFPKIRPQYPHAFLSDQPVMRKLTDRRLARYGGVLGHYHIQENKIDPGPAFDWQRYMSSVRRELNLNPAEGMATK